MAFQPLLLSLLLSAPKHSCPDGEIAAFPCNQITRVCDDDPTLSCHAISGVYFCCAGPHFSSIPSKIPNFVPELQQHQQIPDDYDENQGDNPVSIITTLAPTTKSPDDIECKDENPKNCEEVKKQCGSKALKDVMKQQCRMTCKFCCSDKRKECSFWTKYGFCKSPQITEQKKTELCAKSCGLCGTLRE
ncbi:hypothetical protein M3Y97_00620500 [Aphelenchoides bicaudatus]|nr:hypothetical protein M3Y97_00620500 [Aphelenchoides bicaudatus]